MRQVRTMRRYSLGAQRFVDELPRGSAPALGPWTSLGPGNVGGRTRGIVIDPQNPNIMFAGGATGGIWKTTDGGASWVAQSDFAPVLATNSLAMSPWDSSTLYAGTGEQTQSWRGAGIFKTTDAGNTWAQLPATANSSFYYVNKVAVSNTTASQVYAATSSGLWSSPDGGATWNKAFSTGSSGCFDLALQPGQATDVVFAVCQPAGSSTYTIYRNLDAAGKGTWVNVFSDPNMYTTTLAIAPSQPSTIFAVATPYSSTTYSGALLAVYRSQSNGDAGSWTTQTSNQNTSRLDSGILSGDAFYYFPAAFCNPSSTPNFSGQGSYNLVAAVDPLDANILWVGGINLFRSDDGGVTWGYAAGSPWGSLTGGNHPDQHVLVFPPGYDGAGNQTLIAGSDGGVYATSQARGKTGTCASSSYTVYWNALNNGYGTTQFYHGVPYPGGNAYFGGTQDNGTVRGTDAGGPNQWTRIFTGDGGVSRLDPIDFTILFTEYVNLDLLRSLDGGYSYQQVIKGITEKSTNFPFIAYYTFDPNNSLRMYIGGTQLWRTEDGANNWTAASVATPTVGGGVNPIYSIAVSPADPNTVVFGSYYGYIFRNSNALAADGSTAWYYTQPRTGTVKHLEFDPNNPSTIYATYTTFRNSPTDNHIYRSTDGGFTWTGIDGSGANGLPDVPVETLLVDPDDSAHLYAGTDLGIFVSLDGGNTWANDDNPFPNTITTNLVIDRTGGVKNLYVFTYGRSVWRVPLGGSPGTCTYSVAPAVTIDATGGVAAVNVATEAGCAWSVLPAKSANATGIGVQPPGSGTGSGQAFFNVQPNNSSVARSAAFQVQNQAVTVTQLAASTAAIGDELSSAQVVPSLPYQNFAFNTNLTLNAASDPKHSCTGSQDFRTGWYVFTAPADMSVQVTTQGFSSAGDIGVVLTAYPYDGKTLGSELGCLVLPKQSGVHTYGSIAFAVAGGKTVALEISATSATTAASGIVYFGMIVAPPAPTAGVMPPSATLLAGTTQQFAAQFGNLANAAVRWTVSPSLGFVSATGLYTAPALIDNPTPVTVTATSLANPGLAGAATVTVQPPPLSVAQGGVVNAASFQQGPVSPGEIVTIFGASMGPATLATAQLDAQGKVATTLAGTQVLFDNIPAPLVYSSATQVAAIVPYEVAGQPSTQIVVTRNGQRSTPQTLPVIATAPAFFTAKSSGSGPAAASNQDGLSNSAYPAPRGTFVTLYGTGEGQTVPPGVTGGVNNSVYPAPAAPYSVKIGGVDAEIQYFGAAPQEMAGVLQVNVKVPTTLPPGPQPVVMTVGGVQSRSDVTLQVLGPDGRTGAPAYRNTGSTPVTLTLYQPDTPTTPIPVGTVQPGTPNTTFIFTKFQAGNDWWIQVNSSPLRVISEVCDYAVSTTFGPFWSCVGSADAPFPR